MLDTTITLIEIPVPKQFTVGGNRENVLADYSTECYIDLEGNIGHKNEYFAYKNFDSFLIDNKKAMQFLAMMRAKAAKEFQLIINSELQLN
jgi:glutamate mutase epsilon subunit